MKKTMIVLVAVLASVGAQAQLKIGIKAGANFANLDGISLDTKTKTGFHFGAIAELKLPGSFALQPEVLYSSQGAEVNTQAVKDIKYDYITIPVLVKYYLVKDLINIELGPQFSFLVSDNQDNNDANNFNINDSSTFDFAAVGGVGVDLGSHIFLQGRYVLGLSDASTNSFYNAVTDSEYRSSAKNRVFQISVGYKF